MPIAAVVEYGSSIEAVREPSVPSANALIGPILIHSSPRPLRSPSSSASSRRSAGSEAQTRNARTPSAAMRCQAARPPARWKSWTPVSAAAVRLAHARADGGVDARSRAAAVPPPSAASASCSRSSPAGVRPWPPRPATVWRSCVATTQARPLHASSSSAGSMACARLSRSECASTQPSPARRLAQDREHVLRRRGAREVGLLARERPLEEVHVRVVEPRRDAAAREVDALGRDG